MSARPWGVPRPQAKGPPGSGGHYFFSNNVLEGILYFISPHLGSKPPTRVYSTGLASGKFRVTSAGVGVWGWIENEADPIQDGGRRTQTTWTAVDYDD